MKAAPKHKRGYGKKYGKKGFMKTAEALLAILICMIFVVMVFSKVPRGGVPDENLQILHSLRDDMGFRDCVTARNQLCVDSYINSSMPRGNAFIVHMSDTSESAEIGISDRGIFRETIIIAGNITHYRPTIVSLYYWIN